VLVPLLLDGLAPCGCELLCGVLDCGCVLDDGVVGVVFSGADSLGCVSLDCPVSLPAAAPSPGASRSGQLFCANPGAASNWLFCMFNTRCFCPGCGFSDVIGTATNLSPTPKIPPTEITA